MIQNTEMRLEAPRPRNPVATPPNQGITDPVMAV